MDQHMANFYKYCVCLKRICVRGLGIQCSIYFFYQSKLQFVSVPQVLYLLHSLWRLFHMCFHCQLGAFQVAWVVKNMPANAGDTRDMGSIAESVRSPGAGHGNPLQCSCMENPKERGAWSATLHGVAESEMTERVHTMLETILTIFRPILTDSRLRLSLLTLFQKTLHFSLLYLELFSLKHLSLPDMTQCIYLFSYYLPNYNINTLRQELFPIHLPFYP